MTGSGDYIAGVDDIALKFISRRHLIGDGSDNGVEFLGLDDIAPCRKAYECLIYPVSILAAQVIAELGYYLEYSIAVVMGGQGECIPVNVRTLERLERLGGLGFAKEPDTAYRTLQVKDTDAAARLAKV